MIEVKIIKDVIFEIKMIENPNYVTYTTKHNTIIDLNNPQMNYNELSYETEYIDIEQFYDQRTKERYNFAITQKVKEAMYPCFISHNSYLKELNDKEYIIQLREREIKDHMESIESISNELDNSKIIIDRYKKMSIISFIINKIKSFFKDK